MEATIVFKLALTGISLIGGTPVQAEEPTVTDNFENQNYSVYGVGGKL